jgi:hypothetical protein
VRLDHFISRRRWTMRELARGLTVMSRDGTFWKGGSASRSDWVCHPRTDSGVLKK